MFDEFHESSNRFTLASPSPLILPKLTLVKTSPVQSRFYTVATKFSNRFIGTRHFQKHIFRNGKHVYNICVVNKNTRYSSYRFFWSLMSAETLSVSVSASPRTHYFRQSCSFPTLDRLPPLTPEWWFFNTSTSFRKIAGDIKKFNS